jgi:hypothetical protein
MENKNDFSKGSKFIYFITTIELISNVSSMFSTQQHTFLSSLEVPKNTQLDKPFNLYQTLVNKDNKEKTEKQEKVITGKKIKNIKIDIPYINIPSALGSKPQSTNSSKN